MSPLLSGIPTQHYTGSINTDQPSAAARSPTPHAHLAALSLTSLSPNAHLALDQTEAQPNNHHQLMALLARNGIADGTMHLRSTQGADAHYEQQVNVLPENDVANLTVRTRLNEQAQYDIAGIDLHVPSSGR
ncbi:hypothetical protein ACFQDN_21455 [Pseudomonas asuensis]|uniref:Adhesin n=1 Tax=Pseudomonas asuensis TaxID=1825787 RepID=A0ABQ2H3G1_9PSED|nr:hypothetical protein [Pseudomonas asuensis]GGM31921.1 hypothetical protein GCM10009425_48100 [Pseudomonas asuensis]